MAAALVAFRCRLSEQTTMFGWFYAVFSEPNESLIGVARTSSLWEVIYGGKMPSRVII